MLSLISTAILWANSCSPKLAPEGHYQDTPVIADGSADDWKMPLRFSNEKYTFQYNITNDNKNIYVCIASKDYATQLRMLKSGMDICFDPKGEKNRNISIAFPLRKQDAPGSYRNRNGNPINAGDTKSVRSELLLQTTYYNTTGFANMENGQFGITDSSNDIRLGIKLNTDSSLVYEAVVPIKDIPGAEINAGKKSKNFSVGIVLNSVLNQGGGYNNSPRPSFGGRGMRGAMYGGGRGGNSQRSVAEKEEADWYQFRLAAKKTHG